MDWLQIVVLALVQGITEFLPISSSAHLILAPHMFGWSDQGLAFDVAVHLGTLAAVVGYFQRQLSDMLKAGLLMSESSESQKNRRLIGLILVASIPVILAGGLFHDLIASTLRSPLVIAATTIVFGLALLLANRARENPLNEYEITILLALLIGVAQMLALIPGTSRSGITMLAGVLVGMSLTSAARFSFLLAIPVILGSAVFEIFNLIQQPDHLEWSVLIAGTVLSGLSALVCIHWFLKLIEKIGFLPFVIYRLLLGSVLLYLFV